MSWLITGKQYIPAVIGEAFGGGYFAGYISHTADGNPTHALIVAPKATGEVAAAWAANANAPDGVNYSSTVVGGSFTGSITGTTMTVTAVASGKIRPGHAITGTGVALGTTVVSQVSGTTNGVGDYILSVSQNVTSRALTAGASDFDGVSNGTIFKDIDNTVGSGSTIFPAANFCEELSIGGYTDWYLPSRLELDIAYFHLKPGTNANDPNWGINNYAVPKRSLNNTLTYPAQTLIAPFNGSQAFQAVFHFSSTDSVPTGAVIVDFNNGGRVVFGNKTTGYRSRAFRRIAL
jgi:hypothetical protein